MSKELKDAVYLAHFSAAHRDSSSTIIFKTAFQSNGGDLCKSIAAALMSFGGKHAPIKQAYKFLEENKLDCEGVIPGYGSSFYKNERDPNLIECQKHLDERFQLIEQALTVGRFENKLFPNLAFYTAAEAIINFRSIENCDSVMIKARIAAWIDIATNL